MTAKPAQSAPPAVSRRLLRDSIRERLIEDILTGRLQPGERIVETRFAKELGVSQTPVREALGDLELLGFVETSAFRGAQVRRISAEDWAEIYPIRAALEGVAARAAATRISDDDIVHLRGLIDTMRAASVLRDKSAQIDADIAFHQYIVGVSGNRLLKQFWQSMRLATTTFLTMTVSRHPPEELAERHIAVLDALAARDPDAADAAMRRHIQELADTPFTGAPPLA